jgi:hypothetical protein
MLDNATNNATAMQKLEAILMGHETNFPFDHLNNRIRCFPHIINICVSHIVSCTKVSKEYFKLLSSKDDNDNGDDNNDNNDNNGDNNDNSDDDNDDEDDDDDGSGDNNGDSKDDGDGDEDNDEDNDDNDEVLTMLT